MWGYPPTAALVAQLANPTSRWEAAQALAHRLGANTLLVFTKDAEIGTFLPALGFPQTLPRGRAWRAFLADCIAVGRHRGELPFPDATTLTRALGVAAGEDAVVILLGGEPVCAEVVVVRTLLPLLGAVFRGECATLATAAQATVAQQSARRAETLADALDTARRELEQAMQTRAEFLSSASHDLKNPLAAIKGTAQLLRRQALREGTPETTRLVQGLTSIDATTTQMAALIDDLLDVTHQQMDRPLTLEPSNVDLVALVQRVVGAFSQTTERHTLSVEAAIPRLEGRWDARRLERVLGNLIGNAIKYSPDGGDVTVSIREERGADGHWAVVAIADHGLGIPTAELPWVFERFRRGSNVVGRIDGTGIGLASVLQTVEHHGGTVSLTSQEGQGSTVLVRLPLAPAHPDGVEATH